MNGRGAFAGGTRLLERGSLDQTRLAWRLLRDPRVSPLRFAIPALLLGYLASPLDAIPDLLFGIGQADDLGVAVLAFMLMIRVIPRLAPADVVCDHLRDMGLADHESAPQPAREDANYGRSIDARFTVRH